MSPIVAVAAAATNSLYLQQIAIAACRYATIAHYLYAVVAGAANPFIIFSLPPAAIRLLLMPPYTPLSPTPPLQPLPLFITSDAVVANTIAAIIQIQSLPMFCNTIAAVISTAAALPSPLNFKF
ncbi:putative membrane protein [Campylobacter gracilis]|nr:putative membrane protein [Campylobacter gracilis]